ncbi:hypothetical protein Plhal304r1_c080g0165831 [Plasmopara halstedii]
MPRFENTMGTIIYMCMARSFLGSNKSDCYCLLYLRLRITAPTFLRALITPLSRIFLKNSNNPTFF